MVLPLRMFQKWGVQQWEYTATAETRLIYCNPRMGSTSADLVDQGLGSSDPVRMIGIKLHVAAVSANPGGNGSLLLFLPDPCLRLPESNDSKLPFRSISSINCLCIGDHVFAAAL